MILKQSDLDVDLEGLDFELHEELMIDESALRQEWWCNALEIILTGARSLSIRPQTCSIYSMHD